MTAHVSSTDVSRKTAGAMQVTSMFPMASSDKLDETRAISLTLEFKAAS